MLWNINVIPDYGHGGGVTATILVGNGTHAVVAWEFSAGAGDYDVEELPADWQDIKLGSGETRTAREIADEINAMARPGVSDVLLAIRASLEMAE